MARCRGFGGHSTTPPPVQNLPNYLPAVFPNPVPYPLSPWERVRVREKICRVVQLFVVRGTRVYLCRPNLRYIWESSPVRLYYTQPRQIRKEAAVSIGTVRHGSLDSLLFMYAIFQPILHFYPRPWNE